LVVAELKFFDRVAEGAGVSPELGEPLTEATLGTLTERISGGEAADLAARMPDELRPYLIKSRELADPFSFDEFVRRVSERAGVDAGVAERGIQAVLQTMPSIVGQREFEEALSQLPEEFWKLVRVTPGRR
jgi:uncharacterized protein (DUF2267 family)